MKAVICGAGIAGLALAQRLGTMGWDIVVLEKAPGPRAQGYMIDFFGAGYDAAEAMGILPRLEQLGHHVDEATYVDGTGRRRVGFSYAALARAARGGLVSIMRPDLERVLREQLPARVDLRFATSVRHVASLPGGVRLSLTDGSRLDADLLAGADGIHSKVRELVFGDERRWLRFLGFHTAAFSFDDPEVHAEVQGRFCLTDTVGRLVGVYGFGDGRVGAFTVHRTGVPALPADAQAAVRRVYGSLGWIVPRVLAACPPSADVYYDQVAQIVMPRWSQGRVTLVGDACQAVSLLAGQGASLGIGGAYVLAEQLALAGSIEAGLDRYECMWHPVIRYKQRVARIMANWFLPESLLRLRARRLALRLACLPGLDQYVATSLVGKPTMIVRELNTARLG